MHSSSLFDEGVETADRARVRRLVDQCVPSFDDFWKAWPRREAKKAALKAWSKLTASKRMAAMAALPEHVAQWRRQGRARCHIPHPATWLNGERWDDELECGDGFAEAIRPPARSGPPWWESHVAMETKAREVGLGPARPGETTQQYRARIQQAIEDRNRYGST